jgi:hypothetical protein
MADDVVVEFKIEIIVGTDVDGTARETVVFNDGMDDVEEALLLEVDEDTVVEASVAINVGKEEVEVVEEDNVSLLFKIEVVIC